jgi:hypothetical protein
MDHEILDNQLYTHRQYAPTDNNRTNNLMVTKSDGLMRHLMLERR